MSAILQARSIARSVIGTQLPPVIIAAVIACSCLILLAVFGSIIAGYALGIPVLVNSGWAGLGALLLAGTIWYICEDRRLKRERQRKGPGG